MLTEKNFKTVLNLPCVIIKKPRVVFFRVPKNASTSIHRGYLQPNYVTLNMRTNRKGFTDFMKEVSFSWFQSAFKFMFSRNPWDRFVSLYVYFTTYAPKRVGSPLADRWKGKIPTFKEFTMEFEEICKDRIDIKNHAMHQTQFAFFGEESFVNFVGKFENLKRDFATIRSLSGLTVPQELGHLMKTNHPHYSAFYDEETRRKVHELYIDDIFNFNYHFWTRNTANFNKLPLS